MRQLVKTWRSFDHSTITPRQAKKIYATNQYKQELIDELAREGQELSLYQSGDFSDLCRGGHIDNPQELKYFKLLSLAGAYWRGDEQNNMLTRIYGTAFFSKAELDKYVWQQEEAKKRDHRKLGKELSLFTISQAVGPGLPIWLPKGNVIREELESWAKSTEKDWGYQHVATPHITKSDLYYTSGHLPYYKNDMFPPMVLDDNNEYYLKPMNCPHHHMVYASSPRSYRELPLRLAEYGMCYRYEASGELFGLMRVRSLDINDAHIYCTREQAVEEFVSVMKLHQHFYLNLGITDYHLELALRDPEDTKKYHGNQQMWQDAESLMRQAVSKVDIPMVEEVGSAAFYGPKIDFIIHSSIGREFAISTNQIDLFMGERFGLTYTDSQGESKTPVIIHRAPLGSHERFIGFLIEHFGGSFPVWLSPVQAVVIPIGEDHIVYAKLVSEKLKSAGVRIELSDQAESMQKRIRIAEKQKIPYMLVVGDKEAQSDAVSVRARGKTDLGSLKIDAFIDQITQNIKSKSLKL
jgi:threonyl-tRNA synthetase